MDAGIVEQLKQMVDESQYYNSGIPYNLMDVVHMLIAERDTLTPPPPAADTENPYITLAEAEQQMRRPFPRNPQMLLVPPGFGASLLRNALRSYQKSIYFDPNLPEEAAMMDTLNDLVNAADHLRD